MIDGRGSTTTVTDHLDSFEPNLLIATADKSFPAFLADYGETNHLEVINVFDVRNDLYEDNPSMIQILPPSSLFNEQVADEIVKDFSNRDLMMVGVYDNNDAIGALISEKFPEQNVHKLSVNSLAEYNVTDEGSYLIYAFPQKRSEVEELLAVVTSLKEQHPMAEITVVGRPNWVTMTEVFRDHFRDADIIVPARCWLDMESTEGKRFVEKFNEIYHQDPIKSFPNFAASGYDIANYFINATAENGGDFNENVRRPEKGLQTDFDLKRVSNWGGFLNPVTYLLKFEPSGYVDKEILR